MAPEMRYNAQRADVYSLAKTLWIVLTGIEHGFEGRYEEDDSIIGLRSNHNYKREHLVEIEMLLKQATEYDPALRPNTEKKHAAGTLDLREGKSLRSREYRALGQDLIL